MARPARLSRDAIVAAALELVDARGPAALSMRALARELGVDPMAVYRHVRDKEDLLGAMCDAAIAELTPPVRGAPWEPPVRRLAEELHAAILRRPALLPALAGAPATPAAVALAHDAIAALRDAGVDRQTAMATFTLVFGYVVGMAATALAAPPAADRQTLRDDAATRLADLDAGDLDAALSLMEDDEGAFRRGLELIIDGVRARPA